MNRNAPLDNDTLIHLGFMYDCGLWIHSQEGLFAVKLEPNCFFISFRGFLAKYPYNLTVGELEKQFFERTGKLLF